MNQKIKKLTEKKNRPHTKCTFNRVNVINGQTTCFLQNTIVIKCHKPITNYLLFFFSQTTI